MNGYADENGGMNLQGDGLIVMQKGLKLQLEWIVTCKVRRERRGMNDVV